MKHMKANVPRNCCMRYEVLVLALLLAGPAMAYTGEKLAKDAKVSIAEARAIALKAHPGKITDEELEREARRNRPSISFDIKSGGIDARGWRRRRDRARFGERQRRQKSRLRTID